MSANDLVWVNTSTPTVTSTTFTWGPKQDDDPPPAGVREPRRPKQGPPSLAASADEPSLVGTR